MVTSFSFFTSSFFFSSFVHDSPSPPQDHRRPLLFSSIARRRRRRHIRIDSYPFAFHVRRRRTPSEPTLFIMTFSSTLVFVLTLSCRPLSRATFSLHVPLPHAFTAAAPPSVASNLCPLFSTSATSRRSSVRSSRSSLDSIRRRWSLWVQLCHLLFLLLPSLTFSLVRLK